MGYGVVVNEVAGVAVLRAAEGNLDSWPDLAEAGEEDCRVADAGVADVDTSVEQVGDGCLSLGDGDFEEGSVRRVVIPYDHMLSFMPPGPEAARSQPMRRAAQRASMCQHR